MSYELKVGCGGLIARGYTGRIGGPIKQCTRSFVRGTIWAGGGEFPKP